MVLWPHLPVLGRLLSSSRPTAPGTRAISARFAELLAREIAAGRAGRESAEVASRDPEGGARTGAPLPAARVVKVTGTNGKGSVCAMLEACLLRDGHRVGLFTSPHLISPAERIRVNGEDVAPAALEARAIEVERAVAAHVAAHGEGATPSFFEVLVLVALRVFREAAASVAIFEAGVGGYNDPTSLLAADVAAITSVALDHRDRLGPTVESIAADKVGIATRGSDLVLGPGIPAAALRVIEAGAAARGVALHVATPSDIRAQIRGLAPVRVEIAAGTSVVEADLPLLGDHQIENLATAALLVRRLHERGVIRDVACLRGIEATRWAGRMDLRDPLVPGGPRVLFDVAHNEHGIAALASSLDRRVPRGRRAVLYGASADKEYRTCLPYVPRLAPEVHLAGGFHRAESTAVLAASLPAGCVAAEHDDVAAGLRALLRLDPGAIGEEVARPEVVVVTGSLYLVGAAMEWLAAARGERGAMVEAVVGEGGAMVGGAESGAARVR